jgi:sugar phosphate isomerase/epimerase
MRLGLSSYTYVWSVGVPGYPMPCEPLSAIDLVRKAAAQDVHVVQIADNLPLDRLSEHELSNLQREARALSIEIEVGTCGIEPEQLRRYLRLAERLGSPIVRTLLDSQKRQPSLEEAIAAIKPLACEFSGSGIMLAIENHDRFPAAALLELLERIDSPAVGVCLDTANSLSCLEIPQMTVEALAPWAVNLHIKDFQFVRAPHHKGFVVEGRPAGQGQLDIPAIFDCLRRTCRPMNAILELWPPPEATIEASIVKENAWAAASLGYLRQWIH